MKRMILSIATIVIGALILAACAQGSQATPTAEVKKPVTTAPTGANPTQAASADQKWNNLVAEARKEGSLALYGNWRPETIAAISQPMKDKYGVNIEYSPFARGSDLLVKVQAEQRAGLYNADVFGIGNPTLLTVMKPEGVLASLKPLLMLPEVLDPKGWRAGAVPFTDKDGLALSMIATVMRGVVYNTSLVKDGEITGYLDLLKPRFKGQVSLNDPTVTGSGNAGIAHLGYSAWGEAATVDYLKKMLKDQGMVVERDNRIHMESVAKGKYAVGLIPLPDLLALFLQEKAPIKVAQVKEDNRLSSAAGALGVPTRLAHPSAATVFINWILTKEGQSAFARSFGGPSTRADVSTDGIDPLFVPTPGLTYLSETEDVLAARVKWAELSK